MSTIAGAAATADASLSGLGISEIGSDTQTEEQILGTALAEDNSDVTTDVVDQPVDENAIADDKAQPDKAAKADADEQLEAGTIPPELKGLMSDPKVAPAIQRLVDQNRAYQAYGTVRDARVFKETFPGGVKEALDYRNKAYTLDEADNAFESNDPAAQAQLVSEWFDRVPQAAQGMITAGIKVLQQKNPDGYAQFTSNLVRDFATSQKWDVQLAAIGDGISRLTEQQIAALPQEVKQLLGYTNWLVEAAEKTGIKHQDKARVSPEHDALSKREQTVKQQEDALRVDRANTFIGQVNSGSETQIQQSIKGTLTRILEKSAIPEKGRQKIAAEVYVQVTARLQKDSGYQTDIKSRLREASWDLSKKQAVIDFVVGRSKALVAGVAKEVIADYTESFIAANKAANDKKDASGRRVDITGGQAGSARPRALTPQQMSQMSDADKQAEVDRVLGL